MTQTDLHSILKIILEAIQGKNFIWRLDGSANLIMQGIETTVRDLDIDTNDEGIDIFKNALNKYVIKNFYSEKIKGRSLICNINNFEIEINSYGDRKSDIFDKTKTTNWQGLNIPILPLPYAKKFYQLINRQNKVDLINRYL